MQKTLTFHQKTIAYEDTGKGQPVVLLHGFGEDGTVWKHQVLFLQPHFRLLIPDLPGSGLSELLNESASPSMETYASVVKAMLEKEHIESCVLIGHSMGGYVILAFAELFSTVLKGFGLFHSTAFADTEEKKQTRRRGIDVIRQRGAVTFLRQTTPNLFGSSYKVAHTDEIEVLMERASEFSDAALIQYYEAMIERPDRTEVLRNSAVPVLFILGEQDNAVPFQDVLKQTHLPSNSFVYILEAVGHMGMWEDTDTCNNALREYLQLILNPSA